MQFGHAAARSARHRISTQFLPMLQFLLIKYDLEYGDFGTGHFQYKSQITTTQASASPGDSSMGTTGPDYMGIDGDRDGGGGLGGGGISLPPPSLLN